MEKIVQSVRTLFCALTGLLGAFATVVWANDPPRSSSFRLYGHFSPSVVSFNDGVSRYTRLTDNSYSGGRFGFWLDVPSLSGQTRFNFESSLGLRPSAVLSQFYVAPLIDLNASTLRKLELIHDTKKIGSFSFGMGSMGSDGVSESDLSGTQLAAYVGIADTAGGYTFRTASGILSTVAISSAFPTFDGGRAPRIRWDSPDLALSQFGTFNVAMSFGVEVSDRNLVVNDALADVGVFYRKPLGAFDIKASGGFSIAEVNGNQAPQSAGSVSLRHTPSGWSTTLAGGKRDGGGNYLYSKIGLKRRWSDWGDTSVSLDYYQGYGTVSATSRSESFGIGIVQNIDRSDLQFYVGLRHYDFDQPGLLSYRSSRSLIFGTRWVFRELDTFSFSRGRSEVDWTDTE